MQGLLDRGADVAWRVLLGTGPVLLGAQRRASNQKWCALHEKWHQRGPRCPLLGRSVHISRIPRVIATVCGILFTATLLVPNASDRYLCCSTLPTPNDAKKNSKSECAVCYSTHDDEIHEATLRVHHWFFGQVTRNFPDDALVASESLPELVAS